MTVYDYREITLKDDLCLEISRDTDIENPRENDCNAATFYCLKSPRRKIGDIIDSAYYLNETKRTLAKTGEYAILPIYIYEHQALCYAFGSAVSFSFECVVRICRYRYTDMFGLWAEIHCDNPGR